MKHPIVLLPALALLISPLHATSLVGSWLLQKGPASHSDVVLTFLSDGTYVMAEDGDPKADPSGKDGMERGTYKWNSTTKAFSTKTIVDTNGEWGLSSGDIKSITLKKTSIILGNTGGISLQKIESTTNKLVGSWSIKTGSGYVVVTFLANGTFFFVQDGKADGGGKSGIERGTYTWNASTKKFTPKILVDTNGTWGFSDDSERTISVSGNKLTLTVVGEGKFTLSRVIDSANPKPEPLPKKLLENLTGR